MLFYSVVAAGRLREGGRTIAIIESQNFTSTFFARQFNLRYE